MEKPKFTIIYNSVSDDGYVGICWEFYIDENKSQARYDFLAADAEKYCPTKRQYYHSTDRHHLGAGHWELKNTPSIFEEQEEIRKSLNKQTDLKKVSMNIVNQLFDLAEVPVDKRQAINDKADEFVLSLISERQKVNKWDKLNAEFEKALEKFDEWTPRKRNPIEAATHDSKIHELAIEYCEKTTLPSMDKNLKLMCQRDFCAGFIKCQELQLQNKETETTDTETPIAKLRNQLSPYYSLPDMILNMDVKPEMKALLIKQAKIAKSTNERIKELLVEIEEWKG